MRSCRLLTAFAVLSMSTFVVASLSSPASAKGPTGSVGHINVSTATTSSFVVGIQESVVTLGNPSGTKPRTEGAVSVRYASDTKATGPGSCRGTDVTSFSIVCAPGLADPSQLEGAGDVVSFDRGKDGTGSVGGVALIPANVSPAKATLIASAPHIRPYAKGGSSGPNAIITTDVKGKRVATQYVPGVVAGPTCATGWGDGSAKDFRDATCDTALDLVGETYTPLPADTKWADIAVGIGDIELSADGTKILATNVHDGNVYAGAVAVDGNLTKVAARPAFATNANWRPFGLSTYNGATLVTWSELGSANNLLASIAVASLDLATSTWTTVVEPSSGALAGDGLSFGLLSAAEPDTAGNLVVTFLDLVRQTTSTVFQDAISAPAVVLGSDGVDHWTNNVAASPRLVSHAVDGVPLPSFGRLNRDARWGFTVLTTIDTLKFYSGGLTWYGADGSRYGREQLTWRGEGTGGYQSATRTVDYDRYRDDADLIVKRTGRADEQPWVDTYAFGKSNGLGDLEAVANVALIGNRTWADIDGNGKQDVGELSIAGVAIELLDATGKPIADPSTKAPAVVLSDARGNWVAAVDADVKVRARVAQSNWDADGVFAPGGTYAGWKITKAATGSAGLDNNADPSTRDLLGPGGRSFLAGAADYSIDVGFAPATVAAANFTVGDQVFADTNGDAKPDNGEAPAGGVTVSLFASDCSTAVTDTAGRKVADVDSNSSGSYAFAGLAAGDYCVVASAPAGYRLTSPAKRPVTKLGATAPSDWSIDIGVTTSDAPCVKVTLEVLRPDLAWADANDAASAAPAPQGGPNRTYRGVATNCGTVALSNLVVMPGVVGGAPVTAASLAPGATLPIAQFEGRSQQSIATASVVGTDIVSGKLAGATDPAYVNFPKPVTLPATGATPFPTLRLGAIALTFGCLLQLISARRKRPALSR
jgi:SdrD B-like domain